MKCEICKGSMVQESTNYKTELNGEEIVIEDVPVWVCEQCEATLIDDEVIAAVEDMLTSLDSGLGDEEPPEKIDLG
ncbi:MAG: type II toxin-antitoxin system MqsA family antitoxin [Chloroflexi bacterium]|nr:type II toxin-antitoxin system MqsA family antitoxin [Chloroflexota bacterium]